MNEALERTKPGLVEEMMWSRAVRLPHPEPIYLVALKFRVQGLDKELIGVWATTRLEGEGADFLAVDETAQRFTDWPDADKSPANISRTDPAVAQAKFCADGDISHLESATGTVAR
jgi:hypothetical protein